MGRTIGSAVGWLSGVASCYQVVIKFGLTGACVGCKVVGVRVSRCSLRGSRRMVETERVGWLDELAPILPEQRREIVRQIGAMNVFAISGGRIKALVDGVELPVSSGYRVRVRLLADDTYWVSRVLVRGGKEFVKGEKTGVYCDEVGEQAYRASCFRSYDASEW